MEMQTTWLLEVDVQLLKENKPISPFRRKSFSG
jgi:hypothetical protein